MAIGLVATNPTISHEYENNFAVSRWAFGRLLPHIFLWAILVVLGGLGGCWVVMLDLRTYLASV